MTPVFESLQLAGWRQFAKVDLDFHERLTILTGRNGSGKSTILKILEFHFPLGRMPFFVGTPELDTAGRLKFSSNSADNFLKYRIEFPDGNSIGRITYTDQEKVILSVPKQPDGQYMLSFQGNKPNVPGFALLSEGVEAYYTPIIDVKASLPDPTNFFDKFIESLRQSAPSPDTAWRNIHRIRKSELVRTFFHSSVRNEFANRDALRIIGAFQESLTALLPSELGFRKIDIRENEIAFLTTRGEFSMDSMSHGLSRIVDLAWMAVLLSLSKDNFVITIDEPENHLHPSIQQQLVARLVAFFPQAQFIIATHSPLVVSSVKDSRVYVLNNKIDDQNIESELLDTINKAGTANEILKSVLGLDHTMPFWAEEILNSVANKLTAKHWSYEEIKDVADELETNGLIDYAPHLIKEVIKRREEGGD
ncbi:AAA family ATPase [bacterium]|nr:AAA family ATPase [bacterium]